MSPLIDLLVTVSWREAKSLKNNVCGDINALKYKIQNWNTFKQYVASKIPKKNGHWKFTLNALTDPI